MCRRPEVVSWPASFDQKRTWVRHFPGRSFRGYAAPVATRGAPGCVAAELLKHATTADGDYNLLYYRDVDQFEVDVVIENSAGLLVGVEVKATASVSERDLRGLKKLASVAGAQFKMGVVLYDGTETLPLGDGMWAAPLSGLWGR